jgi:hypothetical protein
VLAMLAAMLLFTLHQIYLFRDRPPEPNPALGLIYADASRILGQATPIYLSVGDMALKWSLAAIVVACAAWAFASTLRREQTSEPL